MCNILRPVAECQQCLKTVELEPLPQLCSQIANTDSSEIGLCGTLTSQTVPNPRDRVCEDCHNSAQLEAERRNDSNSEAKSYPPADHLESSLPPSEMTAHNTVAQHGSLATTSSDAERRMRERRAKYSCPSETSSEGAEDDRVPVDTPAALSRSKAQPPLLETVLVAGTPHVHTPTPRSATTLRIEAPWDEPAPEQASDDPWWYPEIWGPARDLPRELAEFLRRIPPADTFHNHRIYVFHNGEDKVEQATVLLATPEGSRARVVSGALYDEGARLVTRRQLARARYEQLSSEEREKMAKGEQCCIFYPCRVASCPLLHDEEQHQPIKPVGETLLGAMERGYVWRKNWGATRVPGPTPPVSSRRRYGGSRSPPRQPIRGTAAAAQQTSARAEDRGFSGTPSGLSSTACSPARSGSTDRFADRGRVGRIRPAHHRSVVRRDGSPVPSGERTRRERAPCPKPEDS
ncbi:uncharacterized protein GLRG_05668 [Colletotrichum graminicola M1.001]|uniref:Uncharacterized protein n=1 Tax=Colletotrichum graminicola (strain M1.001 / M2 / FGSC 10212) TaxID=645133 RepID=E3QI36_COLGM|nr:uncharacterized protein GLRG_05668 [Colletotrichum graminicola M1.001]EFQ30524.1 hypothetical protein GLRG_05668 [Colletotrichum graminicola M1.001]